MTVIEAFSQEFVRLRKERLTYQTPTLTEANFNGLKSNINLNNNDSMVPRSKHIPSRL